MGFHSLNLDELRDQGTAGGQKTAFEHQVDAFEALNRAFKFDAPQGKGGLLVLPTGAGKTFTTVKWLSDEVLPRNVRVLWLAHSFHLLDQAFREMYHYARWIPKRQALAIRLVSSSPSHDSPSAIEETDDILIMTTQTAITNLHPDAEDRTGTPVQSRFKKWIEAAGRTGLFVVLDEAHHAPAYGCRNLLVGRDTARTGIRVIVPAANLLGLTATPTYTDETRRGWLSKIFETGIIYSADKAKLTAQGILSRPNYIPRPTGKELVVPDDLYDRLVREHKDLPEDIIEKLASDSRRNDYIVQEYVENRDRYGKTIIFADRWFQCVYLKQKLIDRGVRADAIYSKIDADPGSADARNKRSATDNERILNEFKSGKDRSNREKLEVLINVRMLTEGADVPSVRTVFLTRQTTSRILMAQMIGRALRGRKAGGADEANIVMFLDEWKRLVDWATPASLVGGTEETQAVRGYYPLEYVSIRLVEQLSKQINTGGEFRPPPFSRIMPAGWYQTEFVVAGADDSQEQTQSVAEFVMVYEDTKEKTEKFMDRFLRRTPAGWDQETLSPEWAKSQVESWIASHFDPDDDIGNTLELDLTRLARHMAQRQAKPQFYSFDDRGKYDLEGIARTRMRHNALQNDEFLRTEFGRSGSLWRIFYKSYERFSTAFDGAMRRALVEQRHGNGTPPPLPPPIPRRQRELSDPEKAQVKRRDGFQCLCCGAKGKGIRLQIDHIIPYNMGGETTVENSQTLCSVCNRDKRLNELNYLVTSSPLPAPRELELLPRSGREAVEQSVTRLINFFYRCRAVCHLHIHHRSNGRFYKTWEVELYSGNDPKWLAAHKKIVLAHIQDDFGCSWVEDIRIVGAM